MTQTQRPSILVVDADSDHRRAVVHALEEAGCIGVPSVTFADAVERLEGFAYDGLIADVRLPGGDGLDVLDIARARYPQIRCVLTSSFGSIHHAVRALKAGALDYLLKPVSAVQLASLFKPEAMAPAREQAAPR